MRGASLAAAAVAALACAAAAVACSDRAPSPAPPTATSEQPILGGVSDTTDGSVVALLACFGPCSFGSNGLNVESLCSSALIAPNLILTARHCVAPILGGTSNIECPSAKFGAVRAPDSFLVTPNASVYAGGPFLRVEAVEVPPGDELCGHDLAVVRLAAPYVGSPPYAPVITQAPTIGEIYAAIGYGDNAETGGGSGQRRRLDGLTVACVGGSCPFVFTDGTSAVVDPEFAGTTGVCPGDSGGPAVVSGGLVIGVVSRGDGTCHHPIYTRTDAWGAWLEARASEAASRGGYPVPGWALAPTGPDALVDAGPDGGDGGGGAGGPGGPGGPGGASDGGFAFPLDAGGARDGGGPTTLAAGGPFDVGGGCAVAAPGSGRGGIFLLLALAAVVRRLRRRARSAKLDVP